MSKNNTFITTTIKAHKYYVFQSHFDPSIDFLPDSSQLSKKMFSKGTPLPGKKTYR